MHAVNLGRLGGKKGGPARAASLSLERRREISRNAAACRWERRLPEFVRPLFWTRATSFNALTAESDLDLIMYQVLAHGTSEHRAWLAKRFGDDGIRSWLARGQGWGLSAQQVSDWVSPRTYRQWSLKQSARR